MGKSRLPDLFDLIRENDYEGFSSLLDQCCGESPCSSQELGELLIAAAQFADPIFVGHLLSRGAPPNSADLDSNSALYWAVTRSDAQTVSMLIAAGASSDLERPANGMTSLHWACQANDAASIDAILSSNPLTSLNSFDFLGYTPLMHAAQNNNSYICEKLFQKGALVNAHDSDKIGDTALKVALKSGGFEAAECLLRHGANPLIPGWMRLSAFDVASEGAAKGDIQYMDILNKMSSYLMP